MIKIKFDVDLLLQDKTKRHHVQGTICFVAVRKFKLLELLKTHLKLDTYYKVHVLVGHCVYKPGNQNVGKLLRKLKPINARGQN